MRSRLSLPCVLTVFAGAVAVWWWSLPSDPQLAAAESAFAGMVATSFVAVAGRLPL